MHVRDMSPQCIMATEPFELPLTSNDFAIEDRCSNSMLRGLVPAKVSLFGESCGAVCHGTVMWLNVGSHVATSALLSVLINDRSC